ncbi:MAG: rod shape-determining protein [Acidobacteria bacterium]|nr:rod shape-determining protein [Acidobacteriota bacterium]
MIWKRIKGLLINDLAMDLGTVNTLIYSSGDGIVLKEPSTIATHKHSGAMVAIGRDAERMFGREPYGVAVYHPLRNGTIADFDGAEKMIQGFLRQACSRGRKYTRVLFGIPISATDVERHALTEAARQAGVNKVEFVDEGLAAALGSGMMSEDQTKMVIDIGGGTTNFSVIASYGVLLSRCLKIAGIEMTQAIIDHIHQKHHILIGYPTAEEIKIQLGSAIPPKENATRPVLEKSSMDGTPHTMEVCAVDVAQALDKTIQPILNGVQFFLQQVAPEVARGIYHSGIVLTGGGSLLRNLEERFALELGVPVQRAENPLEAVALGAGQLVEDRGLFKKFHVMDGMPESNTLTEAYGLTP